MGNPKYGEFTFSTPNARPTVKGYAHGGKVEQTPMKKGGETKARVKSAKLVGMRMEPEAIVKKEVALLKKAGAPAKLIKHEEREGALMGLKKGGKPKGYQQGGSAESDISSENVFREVNGKYMHNNQEVSKADFDRRKAAADAQMQRMRGPDRSKMSPKDRARSAFSELDAEIEKKPYKNGGTVTEQDMARDNARQKALVPPKKGAGAMSARERQMMQEARDQKMDRAQERGYSDTYKRDEAENRADRKAMQDALMYIPRKVGEGARSAYDAVMGKKKGGEVHSDVAMDKKVVKKAVHKHESAMHPGKPMTKLKKGGDVKGYAMGGTLFSGKPPASGQSSAAAPMPSAGGALTSSMSVAKNAVRDVPAYASQSARPSGLSGLARGMSRNPAPGGRFPAPPMNQAGAAARAAGNVPAYATQSAAPAMKKGGPAKKGVPVHNRTPKC